MSDERSTFYTGSRSWPVSAAVSICSTTSGILSILAARHLSVPPRVQLAGVAVLILFFVVGMWMSILGGGSLLFMGPTEDIGSWTVRGRPVPQKVWRRVLVICYLVPWIAIVLAILIPLAFMASGRLV